MKIEIDDRQSSLKISPKKIRSLVSAVLNFEGCRADEVGIHFVEAAEICQLHQQFFGDPSLTDCISFPIDNSENRPACYALGDVFVCPQVAVEYALEHERDPDEELILYIVHGILHLIGYDDIEKNDRLAMRRAERRQMQQLKKLKLIP